MTKNRRFYRDRQQFIVHAILKARVPRELRVAMIIRSHRYLFAASKAGKAVSQEQLVQRIREALTSQPSLPLTGMALRIARDKGIPIYNLNSENDLALLQEKLNGA